MQFKSGLYTFSVDETEVVRVRTSPKSLFLWGEGNKYLACVEKVSPIDPDFENLVRQVQKVFAQPEKKETSNLQITVPYLMKVEKAKILLHFSDIKAVGQAVYDYTGKKDPKAWLPYLINTAIVIDGTTFIGNYAYYWGNSTLQFSMNTFYANVLSAEQKENAIKSVFTNCQGVLQNG